MMKVELNETEQRLLVEILEIRHQQLAHEIHHTDRQSFKRILREKEKVCEELISKIAVDKPANA